MTGLEGFGPRGVPLAQVAARYLRDAQAFREALRVPALVWEGATGDAGAEDDFLSAPTDTLTSPSPAREGQALIFPVQKRAGPSNAFPMGVTLGRLVTNDLVLPLPGVSRFHAWLRHDARTGQWLCADAQSDHGTFLDGVRLTAGQAALVREGARLSLGSVELRFLTPPWFVAWFEKLIRT